MGLNNLGLGIGINVTGNAIQGFSGIGRVFGRFSSMLPKGISRFGSLSSNVGRTSDQFSSLNKLFPPSANRLKKVSTAFGKFSSKLPLFSGGIAKAKNSLLGFKQQFGKFQSMLPPGMNQLTGLIQKFGKLGLAVGGALFVFMKLSSFARKGVEDLAVFETGMAEVATLLNETGMTFMPEFERQVLDLSAMYGKTIEDMTKASYQAISAGVKAEEAGKFLGLAGKLAIGGVTDMETAVDGLTSIKNAFGLTMNDMIDVSDKMFVAMRAGKTTIGELSRSIGQVAPIAATMKIPLKDVLAAASTLTKGGLVTSEAITSIRQTMIEVMRTTPKFIDTAKKFGIKYDMATVRTKGFANWLSYANKKLVAQGGKMSDLVRSVQGLTGTLVLVNKGMKDNGEILDQMGKSAKTTETAFSKMAETYSQKMRRLSAIARVTSIEMGRFFMPMAKAWADFKINFFYGMTDMFRLLNRISVMMASTTKGTPEQRLFSLRQKLTMEKRKVKELESPTAQAPSHLYMATMGVFGDPKGQIKSEIKEHTSRIKQYQMQIDGLIKKGVKDGLSEFDEELLKKGKKKPPPFRINNVVNIGNKKLHDSQADWELEFLMRNFIPVY